MNLLKLYLKLSSEALVRQDLQGPGNVKGARDHSFLHVPEHWITLATSIIIIIIIIIIITIITISLL